MVAQNVAKPLLTYINNALLGERKPDAPKLTVLVGHDSNIASLLSAMQFQPYQLPQQYEKTPIGGKLVFQRWRDAQNDRELLEDRVRLSVHRTAAQGDAADAANRRSG